MKTKLILVLLFTMLLWFGCHKNTKKLFKEVRVESDVLNFVEANSFEYSNSKKAIPGNVLDSLKQLNGGNLI